MTQDQEATTTPERLLRAIVVESDDESRRLLARHLSHPRVRIDFASSSVEALRLVERLDADVVLMDMLLPLDGIEAFARLLRERGSSARMILTGPGEHRCIEGLESRLGAHAWLKRPFDLTDARRVFLAALALPEEPPAAAAAIDAGADADAADPVRRLLIVEDEPDVLDTLRQLFAHPQIAIEAVADGADGLERAWQTKPHAILVDFFVPRMNGFDVFDELRRASFLPRIVLMSGKAPVEVFSLARRLGAYACFRKPFVDPAELRATVLSALRLQPAG